MDEKSRVNQPLHLKIEALIRLIAPKIMDAAFMDNHPLPKKSLFQEEPFHT